MKKFFLLGLIVGMSAILCAEGLRIGMAGAVKQKVVELDEKVVAKKAAEKRAQQRTLSALNDIVTAGWYDATTLSAVDADLAAGNINPNVTIFGFAGTYTSDADARAVRSRYRPVNKLYRNIRRRPRLPAGGNPDELYR